VTNQLMVLTFSVTVLVLAFPVAHAQGSARPKRMAQDGMTHMMGMMQQMAGTIKQMSAMIADSQMGTDRMKPMAERMGAK
jgi:hypothetical protein